MKFDWHNEHKDTCIYLFDKKYYLLKTYMIKMRPELIVDNENLLVLCKLCFVK